MAWIESDFTLHSRHKFQKHKLESILNIYDHNLTEAQNMFDNGYRRIWDCGNLVYIWKSNATTEAITSKTEIS